MKQVFVIGCGGGGWRTVETLCLLVGPEHVVAVDGDKLEMKNADRVVFRESFDLGRNKAEVLAERYGCRAIPEWFAFGGQSFDESDWLMGEVDNNPARAAILQTCDFNRCRAIIAGNELYSSEAYLYLPEWKGTRLDPRVYYPSIVEDHSNDPRAAAIGCLGEKQRANRQLVTANLMGTALAMHLYVVWALESPKLPKEVWQHLPHKLSQTLSRSESFKAQIKEKGQT